MLRHAGVVAGVVGPAVSGPTVAAASPSLLPVHGGALADGALWEAKVPANWNGTLLLFSHGFGPTLPALAPQETPGSEQALLDGGYALAGSSYAVLGSSWALNTAVRDRLDTLAAVQGTVLPDPAKRVIAVGESMGGLVSSLENEQAHGRLDGVLTACGLVGGGSNLENYQLAGSYVISALLAPQQHIRLAGYLTAADALLAATQLQTTAQSAQQSAQGRARLAPASAFYNVTTSTDGTPTEGDDYAAQERAQYAPGSAVLPVVQTGRASIEQAVGGQPSWTAGVDFAQHENIYRETVDAAGAGALLRQAFVARTGHCIFTAAEVLAALHALEHRIDTDDWGDAADPRSLRAAATALDKGGAAYVPYEPEPLVQ